MQLSVKVLKQDYSFGTKAFLDSEERLSIFKLRSRTYLDCLQSAISLEIRPVLISSSAIANHDAIYNGCFGFAGSNFAKKNKSPSPS